MSLSNLVLVPRFSEYSILFFSDPFYQLITFASVCAKEPYNRFLRIRSKVVIQAFCLNLIRTLNILMFSLIVYYDYLIFRINTLVVIYAFDSSLIRLESVNQVSRISPQSGNSVFCFFFFSSLLIVYPNFTSVLKSTFVDVCAFYSCVQ
jgi:hypothetical protein